MASPLKLSEEAVHKIVVEHLTLRAKPGVVWWHTPNGGSRNIIEASKMKRMGVIPGVPDLFLLRLSQLYGLELKSDKGRLHPTQVAFQERLVDAGAIVATAYGLDAALEQFSAWDLLREPKQARRIFSPA